MSWGHGGHGQLGHSSLENQKIPAVIKALADQRVIYIACGGSTSAAVTGEMIYCVVSLFLLSIGLSVYRKFGKICKYSEEIVNHLTIATV